MASPEVSKEYYSTADIMQRGPFVPSDVGAGCGQMLTFGFFADDFEDAFEEDDFESEVCRIIE